MQQSRLRRAFLSIANIEGRRIDWRGRNNYTIGMRERLYESKHKVAEIATLLPVKDMEQVKAQVLATLMAENGMPNWMAEGRAKLIESMANELPEAMVQRAERAAERKLRIQHERGDMRLDDNGMLVVYGKCFFCGADIVTKEAAEDAKLLERYG